VNKVDYEFEAETLADFKYGVGAQSKSLSEQDLMNKFKQRLYSKFPNSKTQENGSNNVEGKN